MAINIKNYVDISTAFPSANVAGRSFGGLVFTTAEPIVVPTETNHKELLDAYDAYTSGGVSFMTLKEIEVLFGLTSEVYRFAERYYSYVSPSGRFASIMGVSKSTEEPLEDFKRVSVATNMFGSFTFLSVKGSGDSSSANVGSEYDKLVDVAEYNAKLDTKYLFVVNSNVGEDAAPEVVQAAGAALATAFCKTQEQDGISGTVPLVGSSDVSAYMPMAILASTDYENGQVVNFMFKQFETGEPTTTEKPTVEDDETYAALNRAFVNFYGRTQTNGQTLDFYQRGFNADGTDTAVYCNEMWFKARCETALMNLLISRERLPADPLGVDLVKLEIVDCSADAIRNTMFMQKDLTAKDIRGVREIVVSTGGTESDVGSIEADISTKGYSVYAYLDSMEDEQKLGPTSEKVIIYYVFYGTADSVRHIKGNDILLK